MYSVVAEAGITLNSGLFCENVVVLALKEADDFGEAVVGIRQRGGRIGGCEGEPACRRVLHVTRVCAVHADRSPILVVDVVAESGGVYDGETDAHAVLVELYVYGADLYALLDVGGVWVVCDLLSDDVGLCECSEEGRLSCAGCSNCHEAEGDSLLCCAPSGCHFVGLSLGLSWGVGVRVGAGVCAGW